MFYKLHVSLLSPNKDCLYASYGYEAVSRLKPEDTMPENKDDALIKSVVGQVTILAQ